MPHPNGRPWIIAHRGASHAAPENTVEAFVLARDLGADAVELDVRRTVDGSLVVHHDDTIVGMNEPIVAVRFTDIRTSAPHIPTLGEAIEACDGIWIDVEVKNDPREADWDPDDQVVAAIAHDHASDPIVVTSFNPQTVAAATSAGLRSGLLLTRDFDPIQAAEPAAKQGIEFLLPNANALDEVAGPRIIAAAVEAGVELAVWTVDDPREIERLAQLGVGGIATNRPDVAASVLHDDGNSGSS